jgi:hypothetical protein
MTITIQINTDNAAFGVDNGGPEQELARILSDYIQPLRNGIAELRPRRLYDVNGNPCGNVSLTSGLATSGLLNAKD